MKTRLTFLALGLLLAAGTAQAQQRQQPDPQTRREAMRARHEAMQQHRDAMRHRFENMTPEQKAFFQALRSERGGIRDQVKAGTLDRLGARQALRAWIQANRPPRPQG
ncbi:MAG: hypothetical protein EXR93_02150 [Gemmatimonadetes bacterium]|nr:hypothetical protein [Gemmatimonadota bacterium]